MAQESELPTASRLENATFYSAVFCRYKPGMVEQARSYIQDYFLRVDDQIGREVIAFNGETGPWDHMVYFPLTEGPDEYTWGTSPTEERWWRAFAELAGGVEEAQAIWSQYESAIDRCETRLVYMKQ